MDTYDAKTRASHQYTRPKTGKQTPRVRTTRNLKTADGDQYETIESRPKSRAVEKTRTYQFPIMCLDDIPQWRPKTPKLPKRTAWSLSRDEDPPNRIRTQRPPRVQTAKISTIRPQDWDKFSSQMKMYLPRDFQFLLKDPEVFRRLLRDPDWLAKLKDFLNEEVMTYLRVVRSARVERPSKVKEETRIASVTKKKDINVVKLPLVKAWQDDSIPAIKLDVGQPRVAEKEKTLIFVGSAGTGKTTLVDSMVNYILGVKWEDDFRLKVSGGVESNNWVNAFCIPSTNDTKLPYTLNVVDFPAYGRSNENNDEDESWMDNFKAFFGKYEEHHIDSIHTICFVQRADAESIPPVQKFVYQKMVSTFGDEVNGNICNMITFHDKDDEEKLPVVQALESAELPKDQCYVFNNEALYHGVKKDEKEEKQQTAEDDGNEQNSKGDDETKKKSENKSDVDTPEDEDNKSSFFKKFWQKRDENFDKIFENIEKVTPKSLVLNSKQMNDKEELADRINHLRVMIQGTSQKLHQLDVETELLKEHEKEIEQNKDFAYEVYDVEKVKRQAPNCGNNVTNCSICFTTCHQKCGIERDEDKAGCWAMTNGFCRICLGKCKWDKHYNRTFIFYLRISKKDKMFSQLCGEYNSSPKELKKILKKEHQETEKNLQQSLDKSHQGVNTFNKIACRGQDQLSQNAFIDMVIHEELREGTLGWKERIDILVQMKGNVTIKMKGVNSAGKVIK